jgi:hypothetical protein
MRKALPYWEKAQKALREALGGAQWAQVVRSLDQLSRTS